MRNTDATSGSAPVTSTLQTTTRRIAALFRALQGLQPSKPACCNDPHGTRISFQWNITGASFVCRAEIDAHRFDPPLAPGPGRHHVVCGGIWCERARELGVDSSVHSAARHRFLPTTLQRTDDAQSRD